eukprot:7632099-Pyramimonas_sp.AAC.1
MEAFLSLCNSTGHCAITENASRRIFRTFGFTNTFVNALRSCKWMLPCPPASQTTLNRPRKSRWSTSAPYKSTSLSLTGSNGTHP